MDLATFERQRLALFARHGFEGESRWITRPLDRPHPPETRCPQDKTLSRRVETAAPRRHRRDSGARRFRRRQPIPKDAAGIARRRSPHDPDNHARQRRIVSPEPALEPDCGRMSIVSPEPRVRQASDNPSHKATFGVRKKASEMSPFPKDRGTVSQSDLMRERNPCRPEKLATWPVALSGVRR